ncbi:MAG: deaminase [Mariprofundales bacterium]
MFLSHQPDWVAPLLASLPAPDTTSEARMAWVLDLLEQHLIHRSGGPFAAAIFVDGRDAPLAVGLNVVELSRCSLAHAEMMALAAAEQTVGSHDLSTAGVCQLVTSCEPCAMCYGAIPWSGIASLVCGATSADARAIGFDEGARHPQWQVQLEERGIAVQTTIHQPRAQMLMESYISNGGTIY